MNWAERTSPGPFLDLDGIRQGLVKFIEALIKNTVGGEKSVTRLVTDWRRALEGPGKAALSVSLERLEVGFPNLSIVYT